MPPHKKLKAGKSWQNVAKEAQAERDKSLAQIGGNVLLPEMPPLNVTRLPEGFLTGEELRITSLSPEEIVRLTSADLLSVQHVSQAFLRRAAIAQKLTNCIAELLNPLTTASTDHQFRGKKGAKGQLHGLPISIKSHIQLAGHRSPGGYIAWWDRPVPKDDALLVKILRRAGAVIIARTTEPQSMMQLECVSNLYGTTVSPHNTALSSGGSSGGAGALLALKGCALSVGSDVGGSIRWPASVAGVYGFKPTGFRIPSSGNGSIPAGADTIPTVLGPMSPTLEGIEMFMRAVLSAEPWREEPALIPLPWRDVQLRPCPERPLRIGIMWDDGVVLPHPPVTRALRDFVHKAKQAPFVELVDFSAYKHDEAWAIVSSLYFTDGGKADADVIDKSGEPWLPLTQWIIKENACCKELTRQEVDYWLEEREEFRSEYNREWNKTGSWDEEAGKWTGTIDALVCPVGPGVANKHGTSKYWPYTAVWNLLDWPALSFPMGVADKTSDKKPHRVSFMSGLDKENWALYDPDIFDSMPVGLQIVGRRFDDETIVSALKHCLRMG